MNRKTSGFTLVEVIVVVAVVSILSAVLYANFNDSRELTRDAQRKADLRLVQNALELYKLDHGRYPEGCNPADPGNPDNPENWSGQLGTNFECPDGGSDYIRGDVSRPFSPGYLPTLPTDPKLNGLNSGYMYLTNRQGTVYKFIVRNTIESEVYNGYGHEFQACDVVYDPNGQLRSAIMPAPPPSGCESYFNSPLPREMNPPSQRCALGTCNMIRIGNSFYRPQDALNECQISNIGTSLAVWGGYTDPKELNSLGSDDAGKVEHGREKIICSMPNPEL